jgi:hypothetical protein
VLTQALIRHPGSACPPVTAIEATVSKTGPCELLVEYVVHGAIAGLKLPAVAMPERRDHLWQATCFELFVALDDGGYAEFNFSPSTCWAAYRFDDYRSGMRDVDGVRPVIDVIATDRRLAVAVRLDLATVVADLDRCLGLSAVIEQADGNKSWWALAHPSDKPDFHHRDCFALQLGAASDS